jgi:hypothetical protein
LESHRETIERPSQSPILPSQEHSEDEDGASTSDLDESQQEVESPEFPNQEYNPALGLPGIQTILPGILPGSTSSLPGSTSSLPASMLSIRLPPYAQSFLPQQPSTALNSPQQPSPRAAPPAAPSAAFPFSNGPLNATDQEELFIELIKQYPCVWDHQSPGFKFKQTKINAWNEICDLCPFVVPHTAAYTPTSAKATLKRIKDTYTKCYAKNKSKTNKSGAAPTTLHKCKHYDLLGFLNDTAGSQPSEDNIHPLCKAQVPTDVLPPAPPLHTRSEFTDAIRQHAIGIQQPPAPAASTIIIQQPPAPAASTIIISIPAGLRL